MICKIPMPAKTICKAFTVALALTAFLSQAGYSIATTSEATRQINQTHIKLPMTFEANQGQADSGVKFLSRGRGYTLFLAPDELTLTLTKAQKSEVMKQNEKSVVALSESRIQTSKPSSETAVIRMKLIGSKHAPQVSGLEELLAKSNYFIGKDPKKWHKNIPNYARVKYEDVYPGIDAVFYGNPGQLEYDFIITPRANPNAIALQFEGAEKLELSDSGDLLLHASGGIIQFKKPLVYQAVKGVRKEIAGTYVLKSKNQAGFQVSDYDHARPLVIDPVLSYSTYFGDKFTDYAGDLAVDSSGIVYLTGGSCPNACDAFVAKITPASQLIFLTYFGGSGSEIGYGIAVDPSGNVYIAGGTDSTDLPTVNPRQAFLKGSGDAFITKLNPYGSAILYSTYFGGAGEIDGAVDIAVHSGLVYITGSTDSTDYPTFNPFQATFHHVNGDPEPLDAFVAVLNPDELPFLQLVYSTYLGGTYQDFSFGMTVDASGNAYITGSTESQDFPAMNPFQAANPDFDAFVTELNPFQPPSQQLLYSTHIGGQGTGDEEGAFDIVVDSTGKIYITGQTGSSNFPLANSMQDFVNCSDAFVTKLDPAKPPASQLLYSSLLGATSGSDPGCNSSNDRGSGIAVDSSGKIFVTGSTGGSNFSLKNPVQANYGGGYTDAFVIKIDPAQPPASQLLYSTYLGGSAEEGSYSFLREVSVALNQFGNAYVFGPTTSVDFPTENALHPNSLGGGDTFLSEICAESCLEILLKVDAPSLVQVGDFLMYAIQAVNTGPSDATGVVLTDALPKDVKFVDLQFDSSKISCNINDRMMVRCQPASRTGALASGDSFRVEITVQPLNKGVLINKTKVKSNEEDLDYSNNTVVTRTIVQKRR